MADSSERDSAETLSWQGIALGIALVSLEELSEPVMRKVALRFGLGADCFACEETLLSSIQRGACPVVVLDAEVFGTSNDHIDAEIRSFCPELPVAVVSNRLPCLISLPATRRTGDAHQQTSPVWFRTLAAG